MARFGCYLQHALLLTLAWITLVKATDRSCSNGDTCYRCSFPRDHQRSQSKTPTLGSVPVQDDKRFQYIRQRFQETPHHTPHTSPLSTTSSKSVEKRGMAGTPGDIEWMGFFASIVTVPTMLSILGIATNYNLEKSYFNSQINAQYYKQTREMLRAHSAKLIRDQEMKFAKAGQTWDGMIYDQYGNVNPGARLPSWKGNVVAMPPIADDQAMVTVNGAGAGAGPGANGSGGGAGQQQDQTQGVNGGPYGTGLGHDDGVGVSKYRMTKHG